MVERLFGKEETRVQFSLGAFPSENSYMNPSQVLSLLSLLLIKHFIVDWCLQSDDEVKHKGTYFHPIGIMHSVKHSLGTVLVTAPFLPSVALALGLIDGFLHYHIDWSKQNIARKLGLSANDNKFWILIGFDQLLHQFCYLALVSSQL